MEEFVRLDSSIPILGLKKSGLGYKGRANVTKTGVFVYLNPDGSLRRELRPPDEVFAEDSLMSLSMIPIVVEHPTQNRGLLTPKIVSSHSVGSTGTDVAHDEELVSVSVAINSDVGIDAIENQGKQELSCGYTYARDMTPGIYNGMAYDCIQRNIRYNHLAITKRGRAGKKVRLNIAHDGIEVVEVIPDESSNNQNNTKRSTSMLVKLALDGIEYEVPPEVKRAFDKTKTALDTALEDVSKITKEKDTLAAAKDSAEEALTAEKEKYSGENLSALIKARTKLEKIATDSLSAEAAKNVPEMSDKQIKIAVIQAKFPKAEGLDSQSDDYLEARFHSALEVAIDSQSSNGNNYRVLEDGENGKNRQVAGDSVSARQKMTERLCNAYKTDKE